MEVAAGLAPLVQHGAKPGFAWFARGVSSSMIRHLVNSTLLHCLFALVEWGLLLVAVVRSGFFYYELASSFALSPHVNITGRCMPSILTLE